MQTNPNIHVNLYKKIKDIKLMQPACFKKFSHLIT